MTLKRFYEFGNFRLDTAERELRSAGHPLSLTPKALDVLIVLIENRGRIVEKEDLMRKVWPDTFVEENNLAFNISTLRKIFGETGASPRYIETVPKRGYRFVAEVMESSGLNAEMNAGEEVALRIDPVTMPPLVLTLRNDNFTDTGFAFAMLHLDGLLLPIAAGELAQGLPGARHSTRRHGVGQARAGDAGDGAGDDRADAR